MSGPERKSSESHKSNFQVNHIHKINPVKRQIKRIRKKGRNALRNLSFITKVNAKTPDLPVLKTGNVYLTTTAFDYGSLVLHLVHFVYFLF